MLGGIDHTATKYRDATLSHGRVISECFNHVYTALIESYNHTVTATAVPVLKPEDETRSSAPAPVLSFRHS